MKSLKNKLQIEIILLAFGMPLHSLISSLCIFIVQQSTK